MGVVDLHFRKWLRKRPCDICRQGNWNQDKGEWQNEVMHLTARGMGGKGQKCDDAGNCITGCWLCHAISHKGTKEDFEKEFKVNLDKLAETVWDIWQER